MAKRWLLLLLIAWLGLATVVHAEPDEHEHDQDAPFAELGTEYLFMWMRAAAFPTLITTGSARDPVPGALGQPNTKVLFGGDQSHGLGVAGRVTARYWFTGPKVLGIEANYFGAEQQTNSANFAGNGTSTSPVITRPFFNPVLGKEDADPRAFPTLLAGNANFNYMTRLMGAETNLRWNPTGDYDEGFIMGFIGGVRFLRLDEKYFAQDFARDVPAGGDTFSFYDNFTTYNQFVGGQVGTQAKFRWDRNLSFDVQGKVAVGPNFQTLQINGLTNVTDNATGRLIATGNQGLYAQPTNVGRFHSQPVSVVPEINCNFNWEIFRFCYFHVGYTFLYATNVLRPGDQIDRTVNIQSLGGPALFQPLRPAPVMHQTDMWIQFVQLGLTFNY